MFQESNNRVINILQSLDIIKRLQVRTKPFLTFIQFAKILRP